MEGEVEKIFTQTHMGLEGAEIKKKKNGRMLNLSIFMKRCLGVKR